MRKFSRLLFLTAAIAAAQQSPPPPATFRVRTELVQVSVVAQDKQGNPVADIRREEFQVSDNVAAQEIRLFVAEQSDSSPPEPKAPNTFTNRNSSSAGSRSGHSVILIDNFLTNFGDPIKGETGSGYAAQRTLRVLRSIPTGESIAIYALQRKLRVICEFTTDRDLLERQLRTWKEGVDTPSTSADILGNGSQEGDASAEFRMEAGRQDMLRRVSARICSGGCPPVMARWNR